jgi:uncharacterized membrane protein
MKTSEILKLIEQMFQEDRPSNEIYATATRYRKLAEIEEQAVLNSLTPEEKLVLEVLNTRMDYIPQDDVARKVGVPVQRVIWILERLSKGGYSEWANGGRYRIEQKGRDVLYGTTT